MNPPTLRDFLLLHLVVLAWGFTAILGKLIHLPPLELVLWRTALAALGFAFLARACGASLRLPRGQALRILGLGLLLGLHWVLFFASARLATASVCLAAMPTAMLFCSLIEPWVDGSRRWRPAELLVGSIIVGAVWLIYEVELRYWAGFTVALISALVASVFAVLNKQMVAGCHHAVMGAYQMTGACLACVAGWPFAGASTLSTPTWADVLWLLLLSSVCTVGAYAAYMVVLRRMSVFTVNVIYNLEPVYGILLAALVFGRQEHMSGGFYVGASIIVVCVLLVPWLRRWVERRSA